MKKKGNSSILGAPNGYKGYGETSTLLETVAINSSSPVLLEETRTEEYNSNNITNLQGLLSFLEENNSNSEQQKLLLEEMLEKGNNILEDIMITEQFGKQIISIQTGKGKIDLIPANEEFGASIIKDSKSGNIGVFLYYQKGTFNGSLVIDLDELSVMFEEGSYFISKENGEVCIKDFGVEGKCRLNSEFGESFQISGVKPEEIQLVEKEIDKLGIESVDFILTSCDNDLKLFADTLLLNKYITKEVADIIRRMDGNIDIV